MTIPLIDVEAASGVSLPVDAPTWARAIVAKPIPETTIAVLRRALAGAPEVLREAAARFPPYTVLRCSCCARYVVVTGLHPDPNDEGRVHLEVAPEPKGRRGCLPLEDTERFVATLPAGMTPDVMRVLLASSGDA